MIDCCVIVECDSLTAIKARSGKVRNCSVVNAMKVEDKNDVWRLVITGPFEPTAQGMPWPKASLWQRQDGMYDVILDDVEMTGG